MANGPNGLEPLDPIEAIKVGGYGVLTAVFTVGVNFIEALILREQGGPVALVAAVPYELLLAAFGLLWSSYISAPADRSGWTVPPFIAVGAGFFLTWISMGLTKPDIVNWPFSQGGYLAIIFRVWLPDIIALLVLVWAVVVARRISLG